MSEVALGGVSGGAAGPAEVELLAGFTGVPPEAASGEVVFAHLLIVSLLSGNVKAPVTPLNYGAGAGAGAGWACSGACCPGGVC